MLQHFIIAPPDARNQLLICIFRKQLPLVVKKLTNIAFPQKKLAVFTHNAFLQPF
jgi:hypothetical protein